VVVVIAVGPVPEQRDTTYRITEHEAHIREEWSWVAKSEYEISAARAKELTDVFYHLAGHRERERSILGAAALAHQGKDAPRLRYHVSAPNTGAVDPVFRVQG